MAALSFVEMSQTSAPRPYDRGRKFNAIECLHEFMRQVGYSNHEPSACAMMPGNAGAYLPQRTNRYLASPRSAITVRWAWYSASR